MGCVFQELCCKSQQRYVAVSGRGMGSREGSGFFFLMIGGITAYSRADGNDQIERDSTDDGQRVGTRGLP